MLAPIVPRALEPKGKRQALHVKREASTMEALKLPHEPEECNLSGYELPEVRAPLMTQGSTKRRAWKCKKEVLVKAFLEKNGFRDLHSPRKSSRCRLARLLWGAKEKIYPIHEAAHQGDSLMLLLCLRQGVDPFQRTSRGRTALELGLDAEQWGSHNDVINALTEPPETLSVHGFLRMKG